MSKASSPDGENKLDNLGNDDHWTMKGNYKRKAMQDFNNRPPNLEDPSSLEYMPSIKGLGNQYYNQYVDRKTSARKDLAAHGSMSKDYINYINYPPGTLKPSGLKIFPALGMISNKDTYLTHNQTEQKVLARNPTGIDAYNNA